MPTAREIPVRVLKEVEAVFGYPVADEGLRSALLASWESDVKDDATFEEIFGFFAAGAVAWLAEGNPAPPPEVAANAASGKRLELDDDDDEDELTPETPALVACHFCGLLAIQLMPVPRPARTWLADLNVPLAGQGPAPIYLWYDGPFPEAAVYASEEERQAVRRLIRDLQNAAVDEDQAAMTKIAGQLRDKHPRAFAVEHANLLKKNCLPAPLRKPPADIKLTDAAGARIWGAYRAFLPAGRVLIGRAAGKRSERLTAPEAKALVDLGASDKSWPPALLAGLLGPALAGDQAAAKKAAEAIQKSRAGVPLTQRWAALVAGGEGPFAG